MVFSSMTFLWIFLPFTLGVYYLSVLIKNEKAKLYYKNSVLLVLSLVFYAWGGLYYLAIMVVSMVGNYAFACFVDMQKERPKTRKTIFIISVIFNLGLLVYFKYFNFLGSIIENIANCNLGLREVVLPIGISFFTFQSMSYVIDVYLGKVECQKNPLIVMLYVSFFPQLIAGPIVKYKDIEEQLVSRKENLTDFCYGIKRFIFGLGKKVIISNTLGLVVDNIFASPEGSAGTIIVWIAMICYALQILYDFSGYSDMAIGLGKMFGFTFNENFNKPYTALSVQDFWRRWHISLSSWFKEYVYIPLGGNRKGKIRTYINLFIVFLLTGIWHGANYTFIAWGLLYGVVLIIERLGLGKLLQKNKFKPLNWLYTMFVVLILWVFFRAPYLKAAFATLKTMFSFSKGTILVQQIALKEWIVLILAILFAGPIQKFAGFIRTKVNLPYAVKFWVEYVVMFIILFVCVLLLVNNTFNPFIYFQF